MRAPTLSPEERSVILGDARVALPETMPAAEICRRLEDAEMAFGDAFRTQPRMRTRALAGARMCREIREELALRKVPS